MLRYQLAFSTFMVALGTQAASAACSGAPLTSQDIEVCIIEPLSFGDVTAPQLGDGSLVVTPNGQRFLSVHVNENPSYRNGVSPATIRVRGLPNSRFRLRIIANTPGIDRFSTDLGPGNEGVVGPTGEKEINVGAMIRLNRSQVGASNERFTVIAELIE